MVQWFFSTRNHTLISLKISIVLFKHAWVAEMLKRVDVNFWLPRNQIDKQRFIANLKIGFKFWQGGNLKIKEKTQTKFQSELWPTFCQSLTVILDTPLCYKSVLQFPKHCAKCKLFIDEPLNCMHLIFYVHFWIYVHLRKDSVIIVLASNGKSID